MLGAAGAGARTLTPTLAQPTLKVSMSNEIRTFVWFGSLATVRPRMVIERCQQLKVTARAELRSGGKRGIVEIVGGDAIAVAGADPKVIASWMDGSFRVTQV